MTAAPEIEAYLAHSADTATEDVSALVREYLAAAAAHLEALHRDGAPGEQVDTAHSDLMDRLVRRLFELAEEFYFAGGGEEVAGLCVLAAGGYARREMNVHSDVDLLFLYRDKVSSHVAAVAERVQLWLWDANLAVGAATRTIDDTIALARKDSTVATSILASRFLAGSGVLFHEFQERVRAKLFSNPLQFIDEQLESQAERHARFGDSLYLLQPNLKDGAGALRDYHLAWWAMQVSQPRAGGRDDFLHLGLLTEPELDELNAALDFLWRLRNSLHLISGRKNDQLSFELQERVAKEFGYDDEGHELAVERFMSAYYRHARAIQTYCSLIVEQCRQRVARPRRRKVRQVAEEFRIADDQLEIPHVRLLREQPIRLLEAFAVAQDEDVRLTRKALRLIREHLHLVDDDYRRDPRARACFLRILESPRRVMRSLIAMNEVGLLGAFLPEWQHVVCRWQHVMYHTYTVDVHSIFLVEELRRLWLGQYDKSFPELAELMRVASDDRVVLYLGALMHDIGKGFGGNHSVKGVERAGPCLERLGIPQEKIDRVLFLVEHHLLMSHLAQRRDLSDPRLILDFGRTVVDRVNLRNLYLLTFADMRASSSKAWTDWKGSLLHELFERTAELLETGGADAGRALEIVERRVETRRKAAESELDKQGFEADRVRQFFDSMPRRYFTAHSPRQIARHASVLLKLAPDALFATARRELRGGFTEFILCTADTHGLYANVAGTLTANDINILGAYVYSTRDGHALEVYRVSTPAGGEEERRMVWDDVERSLDKVLAGEVQVADMLARRRPRVGAEGAPFPAPPSVSITNEESDFYTIVDVSADDRLGLLHDLTRTITEQGFEIYISKAAKIRDQVTDTFYLKDPEGRKLQDVSEIAGLRDALLAATLPRERPDGA